MAKDDNTTLSLTKGDLRALLREAVALALQPGTPVGAIGPEITLRPYREIRHPLDGKTVVCTTPDKGGPIAINGMHPDDFFEVDDAGVAQANTHAANTKAPADLIEQAAAADKQPYATPAPTLRAPVPNVAEVVAANTAAQAEIERLRAQARIDAEEIARFRAANNTPAQPAGGA